MRRHVGDDAAWTALVERPIGELIERRLRDDTVRGIVLTDALIGTFTDAHDLAANRCFLYHVIGGGTGRWDVPVGGMGTVAAQLAAAASGRGPSCAPVSRSWRSRWTTVRRRCAGLRPAGGGPPGVRQRGAGRARPVVGVAGAGRRRGGPGEGQHAAVAAAPVARSQRRAGAGVRRDVPRQRGLRPARPRLPAGRRRDDPRRRPVRDLLPLADRPLDPRPVAARPPAPRR